MNLEQAVAFADIDLQIMFWNPPVPPCAWRLPDFPKGFLKIYSALNCGGRVVFTNGCFDVLHRGHVSWSNRQRRTHRRLNSDESVRLVQTVDTRTKDLAGLAPVDVMFPLDEDTPSQSCPAIEAGHARQG